MRVAIGAGARLVALGAMVVCAAGCAQQRGVPAAVTDVAFEQEAWRFGPNDGLKLITPHYEIYTTITEPRLVAAMPQALESAWSYYQTLVPVDRALEARMRVFLFAERAEFEAFTKRFAGPRARGLLRVRNGGFSERGVAVMQYVSHAVTWPLLTHEGFHQYLYHCVDRRVPAWLNEGLATLCEGQHWSDDGLASFDAWYNPLRRAALTEAVLRDELIDLPRLLDINAGHVIGGSNRLIGKYYGQVWALVLFLMEGEDGKYSEDFRRMCAALGSRELTPALQAAQAGRRVSLGRALFEAYISDDLATVERAYQAFIRTRIVGE